jgi:hypothetical protein
MVDLDIEFNAHDGSAVLVASTAKEPGPRIIRIYLLKEAVFQDLM